VFAFPGSRFPGARDSRPFSFPGKTGTSKRQLFIKRDARQLL